MEADLDLLFEIGTMRFMNRTWEQYHGPKSANVAEHIMRVAWTAQIIAKREGADIAKVTQMALMHDLYTTRAGDAHWLNTQFSTRDKAGAVMATVAGTSLEQDTQLLWDELVDAKTLEAKVVRDADILDVDLEFCELRGKWEFANCNQAVRRRIYEDSLKLETSKQLWQAIQISDPHAWYINEYAGYTQKAPKK